MPTSQVLATEPALRPRMAVHPTLIDSIGTSSFFAQLHEFLDEICGAEQCSIFQVLNGNVQTINEIIGTFEAPRSDSVRETLESCWLSHPDICRIMKTRDCDQPILVRINPNEISDFGTRHRLYRRNGIGDMAIVCSVRAESVYGFTVIRKRKTEPFSDGNISEIGEFSDQLISTIAKHAQMLDQVRFPVMGLKSLCTIESIISSSSTPLTNRETQVCSRILFGVSMSGIASGLSIAEESVVTYRKRAYTRLGIASRQDLLLWYLTLASEGKTDTFPSITPTLKNPDSCTKRTSRCTTGDVRSDRGRKLNEISGAVGAKF